MPTLSLQHRVERVTAPTSEPVSVADAKRHLRVEHSDDDLLIKRLIETAVAYVDVRGALGKAMITQTWAEWFAPNPPQIILSLGPVQSVSSISYYDTDNALQTSLLANYYVLGPSTRTLIKRKTGYAWPTTFTRDDAIKVEYVIGYGDTFRDVPSTVRHAILMLVSHQYENRENELIGTITMFLGPLLKVDQELAHGLRITILVTQTARQKLLLVMKPDPATSRYFTALNTRGFDGQTNSGIRT